MVHVKTGSEIRAMIELGIGIQQSDTSSRWKPAQVYYAINAAIRNWGRRVLVPYVYDPGASFDVSDYKVALPDYIDPRFIRPQWRRYVPYLHPQIPVETHTWVDMPSYVVEPSGTGGSNLRLTAMPYNIEWRVLFWKSPGEIPSSAVKLVSTIDSIASSMTVNKSLPEISSVGYVKMDGEWISYHGRTVQASTTELHNLVRGVQDTVAATHTADAPVEFGVPVDDTRLYDNLAWFARSELYAMLSSATIGEDDYQRRERQMRIARQASDEFWPSYQSSWTPALRPYYGVNVHEVMI